MKKIEAIIRASHFYAVKEALHGSGIDFFTFEDVKGVGQEKSEEMKYRGQEYDLGSIARTKLTIVAADENVKSITDTIIKSAKTGSIGDGKIFISNIEDAIRIRSGEQGNSAL